MTYDNNKYADIINMPRHVSRKHPHMSNYDRAAQFSPFAALTGHDAAVKETARLTEERIEIDENEKAAVNEILQHIMAILHDADSGRQPRAAVTHFVPDIYKEGGAYESKEGIIKKIDNYRKTIIFNDSVEIKIEDIIKIKLI